MPIIAAAGMPVWSWTHCAAGVMLLMNASGLEGSIWTCGIGAFAPAPFGALLAIDGCGDVGLSAYSAAVTVPWLCAMPSICARVIQALPPRRSVPWLPTW